MTTNFSQSKSLRINKVPVFFNWLLPIVLIVFMLSGCTDVIVGAGTMMIGFGQLMLALFKIGLVIIVIFIIIALIASLFGG